MSATEWCSGSSFAADMTCSQCVKHGCRISRNKIVASALVYRRLTTTYTRMRVLHTRALLHTAAPFAHTIYYSAHRYHLAGASWCTQL